MEVASPMPAIKDGLKQRTMSVAVVGLGHAGLPLLCTVAEAGFCVVGLDKDLGCVEALSAGKSPVVDVQDKRLRELIASGQVRFTTSYEAIKSCDVSLICVTTPLTDGAPDLCSVEEVTRRLREVMPHEHLVVLESTTYPGTTSEVLLPILENGGYTVGQDFFLAFSPERVDPGNTFFGVKNTPKLVSGVTPNCTAMAKAFYESALSAQVVALSTPSAAELAKVLENTYRFVNIAMIYEFAMTCHNLGLDAWEVIDAAATKPYGFAPFWPGPGIGGHCIPVDPIYLSWKASRSGAPLHFVELAEKTNRKMTEFVLERVSDLLQKHGLEARASRVLVLGITYKPGVADVRGSPALLVLARLLDAGAQVFYHDPYVERVKVGGRYLNSVEDLYGELPLADAVLVLTDHSQYDWPKVEALSKLIFDTRGVMRHLTSSKVELL